METHFRTLIVVDSIKLSIGNSRRQQFASSVEALREMTIISIKWWLSFVHLQARRFKGRTAEEIDIYNVSLKEVLDMANFSATCNAILTRTLRYKLKKHVIYAL